MYVCTVCTVCTEYVCNKWWRPDLSRFANVLIKGLIGIVEMEVIEDVEWLLRFITFKSAVE